MVPATFNGIPKPVCHYSSMEPSVPYESRQNLFAVPILKIFGKKLPVHLLFTIINASSDDVVLPKIQHLGEMKPLSSIDDPPKPSAVNKVTYNIDSDYVDTQWMQPDSSPYNQCKIHSNLQPVPKTSILVSGNVQIHRQVMLSDANILKETKIALYTLLKIWYNDIKKW